MYFWQSPRNHCLAWDSTTKENVQDIRLRTQIFKLFTINNRKKIYAWCQLWNKKKNALNDQNKGMHTCQVFRFWRKTSFFSAYHPLFWLKTKSSCFKALFQLIKKSLFFFTNVEAYKFLIQNFLPQSYIIIFVGSDFY